jgi:hypothetical protein
LELRLGPEVDDDDDEEPEVAAADEGAASPALLHGSSRLFRPRVLPELLWQLL